MGQMLCVKMAPFHKSGHKYCHIVVRGNQGRFLGDTLPRGTLKPTMHHFHTVYHVLHIILNIQ